MNIVIVESPAKAKTINKYLGASYEVLASFGHVRDLPAKNGSVDPEANFQMIWEVDPKAAGRLNDIAKASSAMARIAFTSFSCRRLSTGRTCRQPTEACAYQVPRVPCFAKISVRRVV